jgi:hypothetical protein
MAGLIETIDLITNLVVADTDLVVFAGDYVDRGPKSAEVISLLMEMESNRPPGSTLFCVGNHDMKHVRYRRTGVFWRGTEFNRMHFGLTPEHIEWMGNGHGVINVNGTWITHAGFLPKDPLDQKVINLVHNRYLKQKNGVWVPASLGEDFEQPKDSVFWTETNNIGRVVYGHNVGSLENPVISNNTFGIDTGCCFGGRLTAYIEDLRTGEVTFEQVKHG